MAARIITADVMAGLAQLPDESVHCVVTSPPYYGLRDYGVVGQLGLEATPREYIDKMVDVFREVRRVLRSDGTLWLNIGDSYAGSWGAQSRGDEYPGSLEGTSPLAARQIQAAQKGKTHTGSLKKTPGLKNKDLIGIPWSLAFALRDDGWWLRKECIWAKPNGMPESTRDRPTSGHEHVFQLAKSANYYYGCEDVKLPPVPESVGRLARAMRGNLGEGAFVVSGGGYAPPGQIPHQGARRSEKQRGHGRRHAGSNDRRDAMEKAKQQSLGASLRSVWWIAPGGFTDAHFATMPEELAAVCILAGCPKGGTVLDPFSGSGTTAIVADRLQRNALGIELNPEYVAMSERRINADRGGLLDLMEAACETV